MKLNLVLVIVLITGCSVNTTQQQFSNVNEFTQYDRMLVQGRALLNNQQRRQAIENHFDIVIQYCHSTYKDSDAKLYSSRSAIESHYYLLKAASEKQNAVVMAQTCAEALFLKGYAILESGRVQKAKQWIEQALEKSPVNSIYLSELGHIHHIQENWEAALKVYQSAESSAENYSPKEQRDNELTRAIRGVGYSLIELGRLKEAERAYLRCLEINQNDQGALNELHFINELKAKNTKTSGI